MSTIQTAPEGRSLWNDARTRLYSNRAARWSAYLLLFLVLLVAIGPNLLPYDYQHQHLGFESKGPDFAAGHYFGTDFAGRDLLARVLEGGRVSLAVGIIATSISLVIGIIYGATAGYIGGRVDNFMMRIVDILYGMPFMFIIILLTVLFKNNIMLVFLAIGCINWLDMARIVRGQTLSLKRKEFVEAAQVGGVTTMKIITRHIIPNLTGIVVIYTTLTIPQVILTESFLSFLGLGITEPRSSWGGLISNGKDQMEVAPHLLVFPAIFLAVTLFAFNFLGDGLRDALDPKDR